MRKSGLLNIKQAAQALNVSEVSLRRWTDSGKLACFRVGARRERRFRREDLWAFLEQGKTPPAPRTVARSTGVETHILLEGMTLDYGSHVCGLYENDLGRMKLSVPFLADGLRHGDTCFVVAAAAARTDILAHLGEVYGDVDAAVASGQLVVSNGMRSATAMLAYFEQRFISATRAGSHNLRVLGDMAWYRHKGLEVGELIDFEIQYNHALAHRFPVVSLCQYDAREFSGTGVLGALKCHEDTFCHPLSRFLS